jgi:uncharacterized protein YukE
VSFISDIEGIIDPGGDPAAIHVAATACRTLASDVRDLTSDLDRAAIGLEKSWKGTAGAQEKSASAAFQSAWSKFSQAVTAYAGLLDQAAGELDTMADAIQTADQKAAKLKEIALATVAVGAGLTFFTFGVSDATAETMAAADIAVAAGVISGLDAFLASAVALLSDVTDAFLPIAARFVMGAAFTLIPEMSAKALLSHENPFDPSSYSVDDIINIAESGLVIMTLGTAAAGVEPLAGLLKARPILASTAYNTAGALVFALPYQFWVEGKPLGDLSTWETIAKSAGISAGTSVVIGGLGATPGPVGRFLGSDSAAGEESAQASSSGAITRALNGLSEATQTGKSDLILNGISVPASMIKYEALFSTPAPNPTPPRAPASPPAPPVPHVPLPQAPGLPPGSATRVVQPGESVWQIAGGNAALAQQIAELNRLDDASLIYPGQVLIIPPAD